VQIEDQFESNVRYYCRVFPEVFERSQGAWVTAQGGRQYLDFFAGAGALNYGHNPPEIKQALIDYLAGDGIVQGLDMATAAKEAFMQAFNATILAPRQLVYRMLFPGPTGTNCVEAALKLARRTTGRRLIIAFRGGFHGMSLGALAATANPFHRAGAGVPLGDVHFLPFYGATDASGDGLALLAQRLAEARGEEEKPAACIVETVPGEGGINVASADWLRRLESLCRAHGVLLMVDDIQAGCGRTGSFFSFEPTGIVPDIVCLSKSLSGMGLPLSLVLVRPECDVLLPGQHSGTFRGNNLAFVTATRALACYWQDQRLMDEVAVKAEMIEARLTAIVAAKAPHVIGRRGRGMMQGLVFDHDAPARAAQKRCFAKGLIVETCGSGDEVLKILCPLTISIEDLQAGLDIIAAASAATDAT
jgi:diaminobutyrate-2-oxoglutarate transaminase